MTVSATQVARRPHHDARATAIALILGAATILAVLIALGWLVTKPLAHHWPLSAEDGVNRYFAQHRDHALNGVSGFFSTIANTTSAIALSALAFIVIRLLTHRWTESLFVATALVAEVSVFLVTTMVVDRARPMVPHLDTAPPTSSFPSGHTAAATALYVAVALVARRHGAAWPVWLLVAVPCAVALSRLYRGMHHPSDVLAGALLGGLCVLLADRVVLTDRLRRPGRR
ncbi:phosphoesterase PA-phosphatase related [Catenulispora acidiphila DSM 44928]|uniref:Phosphoesterase PA-phosphatase related n=1 Tax=Catenulispora acidiphila (strain DSM 44928 / JCM 14897 / NBRC 102108 / NRRL B-24433 / ID139908) TaxID=479433 RepID=C7Q8Z0_CATAD|nr:phosphatase PAP2 family protein [Catenulispora acidiphila]ACU72310.1 phosphoesterase PA-phosphatase related [Catenulispora acidiphila DSM 44928]